MGVAGRQCGRQIASARCTGHQGALKAASARCTGSQCALKTASADGRRFVRGVRGAGGAGFEVKSGLHSAAGCARYRACYVNKLKESDL